MEPRALLDLSVWCSNIECVHGGSKKFARDAPICRFQTANLAGEESRTPHLLSVRKAKHVHAAHGGALDAGKF